MGEAKVRVPGWFRVLAGLLLLWAAMGLLLRQRWARPAFIVSLVAAVVQFGWAFVTTDILATQGPSAAVLPLFIIGIGALALGFCGLAQRRGWIRATGGEAAVRAGRWLLAWRDPLTKDTARCVFPPPLSSSR